MYMQTFLAPSADKQACNYDTECSNININTITITTNIKI